ncbi:hypothetical protein LJC11_04425 [Bacteroidales bacterium OttesenSCG-928-I21]|nr:hypothetical protein [Bacteroidales bacterium OttesenSCG-928-I21]
MGKLKLAHSLWTVPALSDRWGVKNQLEANIWLYAISVLCAKKLGAKIELHTDAFGKELLDFLPYDKVSMTLENFDCHKRAWARGKMLTQSIIDTGVIHIDGDVFLKKEDTIDIRKFAECDVIVQNVEDAGAIYTDNLKLVKDVVKTNGNLYKMMNFDRMTAYCCGVTGFNNAKLKDLYLEKYEEMYSLLMSNENALNILNSEKEVCPDLVAEQYWLQSATEHLNAKPYIMFDTAKIRSQANAAGFQHVIGHQKYTDEGRKNAKERLKILDTNIFNRCKEITDRINSN